MLYPTVTNDVPRNPQTINRYSYCLSNPTKYTDPYGWWTIGIGFYGIGGWAAGGEAGWMIVFDDKGNIGTIQYAGGGGYCGASASGGLQFQVTNANTINDLNGISVQSGGSFSTKSPLLPIGVSAGGEYVQGIGENSYNGISINVGADVGLVPVEVHGMMTHGTVKETDNPLISFIVDINMAIYGDFLFGILNYLTEEPPQVQEYSPDINPLQAYYYYTHYLNH